MATQLFSTVFFSSLAGFATLLGIFLVIKYEDSVRRNITSMISFAGGVLISAAFLELIPESLGLTSNALLIVLISFVAFFLLENLLMFHSHHEIKSKTHTVGPIAVAGLAFHSLIDGIAIAVGFEVGISIGIVTTLAVLLHEFPEGITSMSVLLHSKVNMKKAILYSVVVALATPIGAIATYLFAQGLSRGALGFLMAVAAGSFVYIGAADLVPETHKKFDFNNSLAFLAGTLFIFGATRLL